MNKEEAINLLASLDWSGAEITSLKLKRGDWGGGTTKVNLSDSNGNKYFLSQTTYGIAACMPSYNFSINGNSFQVAYDKKLEQLMNRIFNVYSKIIYLEE